MVDQSLKDLIDMSLMTIDEDGKFGLSQLGRATLKGNIELNRATQLHNDLRFAQTNQLLVANIHLLYLVTPYCVVGTLRADAKTYMDVFSLYKSFAMSDI